ncbi:MULTISPECIES: nitroreductase family protein [unclassified Acinetobacter]|uniref:nitroreductase family protein n=1 Tax=unclassified Acinetobacter TaxID=196816 RepID=UPI0025764ADB|nr:MULTISPECIES: nitroreductase family protein [unclassified Acinetobacter]MDM1758831.1 nitroreductase family protein [Acinetobacter sp. 256-1]MDM1760757.1 nitroreductase family protein [Acinetobacter sp. 251-1]
MTILSKIGQVLATDLSKDILFKRKENQKDECNFLEELRKRRSIYHLGKKVAYPQDDLVSLIKETVYCCPSVLNCQSTRVVILLQKSHAQFWAMVKEIQKKYMHEKAYEGMALKIDESMAAYGTILYFQDLDVIQKLQKLRPLQANDFEVWSEQSLGMVQFAVWGLLASLNLGAALHHYNANINDEILQYYDLPSHWQLKAQMTFGSIMTPADAKSYEDDQVIFRVFS